MPIRSRQRRATCGFGPLAIGQWMLIELSFVFIILTTAISLAGLQLNVAKFKATFTEALVYVGYARHEVAEQLSLAGTWQAPPESAGTLAIDRARSIKAAEGELVRRGATVLGGTERTRVLAVAANYVVLVNYPDWPGTGALAFRPAVPDAGHAASVMLVCGSSVPKGWIAPAGQVASNLPSSHQPFVCRHRR